MCLLNFLQRFPLDTDPDSVLKTTLKEFAATLDEVSSLVQMLF